MWSQGTLYRFDISHKLSSIANFAIKENPHDKRMLHSNSKEKRKERKERKNPEKGLVYFGFLPFTAPLLLAFHRKVNVSAKMFRFLNFSLNSLKTWESKSMWEKKSEMMRKKKRTVPKQKHKSHVCVVGCWLRMYIRGNYFLKECPSIATSVRPEDCEGKQAKSRCCYLLLLI